MFPTLFLLASVAAFVWLVRLAFREFALKVRVQPKRIFLILFLWALVGISFWNLFLNCALADAPLLPSRCGFPFTTVTVYPPEPVVVSGTSSGFQLTVD